MNLENTEIAFRSRTNQELGRAYWLFRLVSYPWLVRSGSTLTQWLLKLGMPIEGLIRETMFRQFCGGETLEECKETIQQLARFNVGTILDYSVEGIEEEKRFNDVALELSRIIDLAAGNQNIPFCVFKMTAIARFELLEKKSKGGSITPEEFKEWERVEHRVHALCLRASKKNVRLFIDAEESWIQPVIDDLALSAMREFNRERTVIFNTLQLYRTDRLAYLEELHRLAEREHFHLGLKIVRGAYMEKERARAEELGEPSPIHPTKAATDEHYDRAIQFCLENRKLISFCAGTHNEASTKRLAESMEKEKIPSSDERIYFSQLLGMSDSLTFNLAAKHFNVAKYVPYGPVRMVFPYLVRRAEENKAIAGQTNRELDQIQQELERRRKKP